MEPLPLHHYVLRYRARLVGGIALIALNAGLNAGLPFLIAGLIDALQSGTVSWRGASVPTRPGHLLFFALLYPAIALFNGFVGLAMRRLAVGLGVVMEYDIRRDLFAHLSRLGPPFYHRERTGDIMTKMTSDLQAVRMYVSQGLLNGTRSLLLFVFAFSVMFHLNPRMAWALLACMPLATLIFFALMQIVGRRYEASQEQYSTISNFAQESFAGLRTLKGFGMEAAQGLRFRQLNREYIRRALSLSRVESPLWPLMALLFSAEVVVLLLLGGREVVLGRLSPGAFVQFYAYLILLQWPLLALGWTLSLAQRGRKSWKRIGTLFAAEPSIADGPLTDPRLDSVRGDVELRDVSLAIGDRLLLRDLNLSIPAGTRVGITGPTGSGKSLLASLLARLLDPSTGSVRIGGRDVREYPLRTFRQQVSLAPQEPFLFSDSLANNLGFGLDGGDSEPLRWAAQLAQLTPDIELFPAGLDTVLGERGVSLSGGQRQRTALGRAVALRPNVLVLDDAFSAVDTQTEARILEHLLPALTDTTLFIISHRVSTLRHCDRILVIEQGRIAADGPHDELASRPGYYRELDEAQRFEAKLEAP